MNFAKRLKKVRESRKYTQKQLADIINISEHSISNYEQSVCEPASCVLLALAQALDVTPEYLIYGENNMNNYTNAIKRELMQLTNFDQIASIKALDLNATVLSHLELSDDLIDQVKMNWNQKAIFERVKDGNIDPSYCTKNYVMEIVLRYCQHRTEMRTKFNLRDGMLRSPEWND